MADLHIEEFYRDTAVILVQLYGVFPRKASVYVEDVAGADSPDEFGLHSKRHLACFGAMIWLAEEGWIRFESTIGQLAIDQATLSQQGFRLLSGIDPQLSPEGEADNPSFSVNRPEALRIDRLRTALNTASSTRLSAIVRQTLFPA